MKEDLGPFLREAIQPPTPVSPEELMARGDGRIKRRRQVLIGSGTAVVVIVAAVGVLILGRPAPVKVNVGGPFGGTSESATPTAAPTTPPALTLSTVSPASGSYNLSIPVGWQYTNESFPSDHTVDLWINPVNKDQRVEVYGSGCVGCITGYNPGATTPVLSGGLPHFNGSSAADATTLVSACQLDYHSSTFRGNFTAQSVPDSSLPATGRIYVTRGANGQIDGWLRVDIWLPSAQQAVAMSIVSSFALKGGPSSLC